MTTHPLSRFSPSRIGSDVEHFLNRSVTLARLIVTQPVHDLDGDNATETVAFSYRGVDYEVDLSERDVHALDALLAPYLANARRVLGKRTTARRPAKATVAQDPKDVRAWAKAEGIEIADRGRVSADVLRRYRESHGG